MSGWLIYIWTRLNYINAFFLLAFAGCILLAFVNGMCATNEHDKKESEELEKTAKKHFIRSLIPIIFFCLMPSQKEAAMIYVIPQMAQSETFNAISKETPEITKLALEALKETLQGMTKKEADND